MIKLKWLVLPLMACALAACAAAAEEESDHASPLDLVQTQYLIDTAGFHAMDEELEETGQIQPGYLGTVNRVTKLIEYTAWPPELSEAADEFHAALAGLAEALESDDGESAAEFADQAHSAQHDLSHAIDGWLTGEGHENGARGESGDHE